jgi:chaperonin GroEL
MTMIVNKQKGNFNALAVKAPTGAVGQIEHFLEDIAVITGGKVINNDADVTPDGEWIGRANKIIADRDMTLVIKGRGKKEDIEKRIKAIKGQIEKETNIHLKEKLEERLAKLTKGVAIVKVGSKTDVDMREKVERVKDAIGAAMAAREGGVVAGGGTAFLRLKGAIDGANEGEKLLESVLEAPTRKLMENGGERGENIDLMIKRIPKVGGNWGYEVNSGKLLDLVKEGIIDPTKVVRLALQNAVAVATSILTTDVLIAIDLEKANEKLKKAQGK